jgi:DNA-binding SARP family transcriptional activator/TolB-like protein
MARVDVSDRSSGSELRRRQSASREEALEISVLGNVSVVFKGQSVRIKSRKSLAVLAYIALNESRQETRERLVGLFWSETEEEKARASLRQTLRELRRYFADAGYSGLQTEKLAVELDLGTFKVDLWDVVHEAEARRVHPLLLTVPRLVDQLLQSLDDIDPSFRSWVLAKRQTFHDRLLRTLEDGLRDGAVDTRTRKLIAEALVSLDPTHEEACRSLMRARAEEGDVAAALRVYKTLWDLLDEDYGMEPSAKTQQLVAEIKQGEIEAGPASMSTPPPVTPVEFATASPAMFSEARAARLRSEPRAEVPAPAKIALLVSQFQINGVAPDKIHLVHGFRHHLIASLIRFREWSVVDGTLAAPGNTGQPANISQYTIDATAYQAGESANVILTLRQNETNTFIWSETFELKLENWFDAQQRIIRRTTTSLNVQLSTERLMRLAREPDVSLAVYDRWLRGQTLMWRFHQADWDRAAQIFEDCIREAPNFSPGYSSLAGWNNAIHIAQPGTFRDPERARHNVELARKAVQLDALDARAQLCLGWAYAMAKQYAQAEPHMDIARELNDSDPWMKIASGLFYAFCGRLDRADALASQTLEMKLVPSPTDWAYLVSIRFIAGDYQAAIDAADRAEDVIRTLRAWKAAALFQLGRHDEARAEAERFLAGIRSFWFGRAPPTDDTIGRWFLHLYPIGDRQIWERLRTGIVGAGVPVAGIEHHGW